MKHQPTMAPSPANGRDRARRQLILLFAAVLTLGFFTPIQAAQAAAPGALLVKDVGVVEGDASSVAVRIVLARRVNHKVSVSYRTIEKRARNGVDFVAVAGTVKFPAGTKARIVRVPVLDDALDEPNERFQMRIYNAVGASIIDRSGRVTIFDDDPAPMMSVGDVSVTEPTSGSSTMSFPVTLSARSGRTVSVTYVVTAGTAASGTDYVASPSTGQLVIPAGSTTGLIPVSILGDNAVESSETLQVGLYSPVNASIIDGAAVGTILDSTAPRLSVADVTVNEGDPARFVVSLNKPAPQTVTFRYSTSNGTATSSSDYTAVSNASGTIAVGSSSTTLTVNTTENTTAEPNETFNLTLSNVVGAVVTDGQAQATIIDDDNKPTLSINDDTVTEGQTATFTVTLSKASSSAVTFTFSTVDGTADAGLDYTSTSNNRTIPAGSTSTTITVATKTDSLVEGDETFFLNISNVTNATPLDAQGKGTIKDGTSQPTLTLSGPTASVAEGSSAILKVTMSAVSTQPVTVDWTAGGGSAEPADYAPDSGTVTIPAGQTSVQFVVNIVDDTTKEDAETFDVTLSNPKNATIASPSAGRATVTIAAND